MAEREPSKPPPGREVRLKWPWVVFGGAVLSAVAVRMIAPSEPVRKKAEPASSPARPTELPDASLSAEAPPEPAPSAEPPYLEVDGGTLEEQKQALLVNLGRELELDEKAADEVRSIVMGERWLGQGNPKVTKHPMTRAECRELRKERAPLPAGEPRCGKPHMVPLFDPTRGETRDQAKVCIDQYEFPNIPCEYPVVWVRADQASRLCRAIGKRLCDAHEWEGACAGALKTPDEEYAFGQRRMMIEYLHNQKREIVWAYGKTKDYSLCATNSRKSPGCLTPTFQMCGSNTYPAGAFPDCRSSFGVFDLHGNAAEHMNLPLELEQLASRGGLGETEMKGSWFIFQRGEAHLDDCRWRAPMWHHTRVDDRTSHFNYHLGFRCCRNVEEK